MSYIPELYTTRNSTVSTSVHELVINTWCDSQTVLLDRAEGQVPFTVVNLQQYLYSYLKCFFVTRFSRLTLFMKIMTVYSESIME